MKKLISKVIPLVILCGLIICCPSLTKTASAGPAKTVSIRAICNGINGNTISDGISFNIQD